MTKQDLRQRTKLFAISVLKLYPKLPKQEPFQILGKQLVRSATSVGANTRESFRSRSKKEFISKVNIVINEADESLYWLELFEEVLEQRHMPEVLTLAKEANSLTSIFTSISKKFQDKKQE